jgi:hypothetical protein
MQQCSSIDQHKHHVDVFMVVLLVCVTLLHMYSHAPVQRIVNKADFPIDHEHKAYLNSGHSVGTLLLKNQ